MVSIFRIDRERFAVDRHGKYWTQLLIDKVLVPVEVEGYIYQQGGLSGALYECDEEDADFALIRANEDNDDEPNQWGN